MSKITGANFDAVKGVFLIGNPHHKSGLACNVDSNGGTTTKNVNGLTVLVGSIPANWVSKTLDVCAYVSVDHCLKKERDVLTSYRVMAFVTLLMALELLLNICLTSLMPTFRTRASSLFLESFAVLRHMHCTMKD